MSDSTDRTDSSQHERLAGLLGAYADDELAADVRRTVEAHVSHCDQCTQDLRAQLALKNRLRAEVVGAEPSTALARLQDHVAGLGRDAGDERRPGRTERPAGRSFLL